MRNESPAADDLACSHVFLGSGHEQNERRTWAVIALCSVMMVVEIAGGSIFGSLALVADGLHMSTHAGAMLIAALAYTYARRHAADSRFSFGTGKLGDLAGFAGAIVLAMIALLIGYEALMRFLAPVPIRFREAIPIAVIGLIVNVISAWLLSGHESHDHGDADPPTAAISRDNSIRSAYLHVIADAFVSILAIVGLVLARTFGWLWMDPLAGIIGALVVANWSYGLLRDTGGVLLDMCPDTVTTEKLRTALESDGDRVVDLHLWRLGPGHLGAIVSVSTGRPRDARFYRSLLRPYRALSHVTVEVLSKV
jgi:cation diffusion facilitator family transporter